MLDVAFASSRVVVKIDGAVRLDGQLRFTVYENGSNEVGKFKRAFTFTATAKGGAILTSTIKNYTATATYPNGGFWRTSKTPVGGFIFICLRGEKSPVVDIELLENTDCGVPVTMSINGTHPAQFGTK